MNDKQAAPVVAEIFKCIGNMSDHEIDPKLRGIVSSWGDAPSALEILHVVDDAIFGALASGFVISVLQFQYDIALEREGTTHEEMVKLAVWRDRSKSS